jgi:hypothetical protein
VDKPTPSAHIAGPNGLAGWTLDWPLPDHPHERFPATLVIARNHRVIRKIDCGGIISTWIFWNNGRQVAYESGPLHFDLRCILTSMQTGKELANYDCYHDIPANAPDWVQALEKTR